LAGYPPGKMIVITNGFDTNKYYPDSKAGLKLRNEIGVTGNDILIGIVGRFHPVKGHKIFIDMAVELSALRPDVRFLLCGTKMDKQNETLMGWINKSGISELFHPIGERKGMRAVYSALDMTVLCSTSEAFPMTVGESMACGTLCVTNDVGDAAKIVGDRQFVVGEYKVTAYIKKITSILDKGDADLAAMKMKARDRIEKMFPIGKIVKEYEKEYRGLVAHQSKQINML
jgi:glycosyltransferase involved in cell wall biosynthesis